MNKIKPIILIVAIIVFVVMAYFFGENEKKKILENDDVITFDELLKNVNLEDIDNDDNDNDDNEDADDEKLDDNDSNEAESENVDEEKVSNDESEGFHLKTNKLICKIKDKSLQFDSANTSFVSDYLEATQTYTAQKAKERYFFRKDAVAKNELAFYIVIIDSNEEKAYIKKFDQYDEYKLFLDTYADKEYKLTFVLNENGNPVEYKFMLKLDSTDVIQ